MGGMGCLIASNNKKRTKFWCWSDHDPDQRIS